MHQMQLMEGKILELSMHLIQHQIIVKISFGEDIVIGICQHELILMLQKQIVKQSYENYNFYIVNINEGIIKAYYDLFDKVNMMFIIGLQHKMHTIEDV
jgi:hypothetical protein